MRQTIAIAKAAIASSNLTLRRGWSTGFAAAASFGGSSIAIQPLLAEPRAHGARDLRSVDPRFGLEGRCIAHWNSWRSQALHRTPEFLGDGGRDLRAEPG